MKIMGEILAPLKPVIKLSLFAIVPGAPCVGEAASVIHFSSNMMKKILQKE